ncbi:MAG TPA: aspartate 1-decarboxylase [Bacteroidia bacterium]|nr:aspartate 1-decarboxylase [Sphingobacteriales bacterium]HPD65225.1 aspartate 1-decarboxylase [Bacteroidia bacterium]HRS58604.1 aspartate 1-decarboxylase [Bacteroidia bacterium]HRU68029.1 aspartate 1-decarboxylase [Bacteroidia bacterium]
MFIEVLKSKIHRVRCTEADLNYMGSITIDEDYMDAVGLIANEKVQVLNLTNGERLETYVIKGGRGTKVIGLNGPAAHKGKVGDILVIVSYAMVEVSKASEIIPKILLPEPGKDTIN